VDPELLRTFLAVVEHGGLRRAAASVHRTQPALSARLRELERRIGARLFERVGRRLELTEAGRLLAAEAPAHLAAGAALAERVQDLDVSERGRLRLATIDAASIYVLPPIYRDFRAACPGVQLVVQVIESRRVAAAVASREAEVGVLALPVAAPDLECTAIFEERLVCIAAPTHRLAGARRLHLADLAAEPLVLYGRGSTTRAMLDAGFAAAGVTPQVAMETASPEAMKRLAEAGVGITVVPEALVRDDVATGRLVRLAVRDARFERRLATVVLRGRRLSSAAARFLALTHARFRPLAAHKDAGPAVAGEPRARRQRRRVTARTVSSRTAT
jgi:DNA-binding transcriptional LysR family regulator